MSELLCHLDMATLARSRHSGGPAYCSDIGSPQETRAVHRFELANERWKLTFGRVPMAAARTRVIAGIVVPDSPLITDALEYARGLSDPYLLNHAMRSWLFAAKIAQAKAIDCDQEVVAIGTILHDIGLTAGVPGANRFEVNGADAALSRDGLR